MATVEGWWRGWNGVDSQSVDLLLQETIKAVSLQVETVGDHRHKSLSSFVSLLQKNPKIMESEGSIVISGLLKAIRSILIGKDKVRANNSPLCTIADDICGRLSGAYGFLSSNAISSWSCSQILLCRELLLYQHFSQSETTLVGPEILQEIVTWTKSLLDSVSDGMQINSLLSMVEAVAETVSLDAEFYGSVITYYGSLRAKDIDAPHIFSLIAALKPQQVEEFLVQIHGRMKAAILSGCDINKFSAAVFSWQLLLQAFSHSDKVKAVRKEVSTSLSLVMAMAPVLNESSDDQSTKCISATLSCLVLALSLGVVEVSARILSQIASLTLLLPSRMDAAILLGKIDVIFTMASRHTNTILATIGSFITILQAVLAACWTYCHNESSSSESRIRVLQAVARLLKFLCTVSPQIDDYVEPVILHCVSLQLHHCLPTSLRAIVEPGIFDLISLCKSDKIQRMHVQLSDAGRAVLAKWASTFSTHFKYRGDK